MHNSKHILGIGYWIAYLTFMCIFFYVDTIDEYRNSEKNKGEVVKRLSTKGYKGRWYSYPQIKFVYNDSVYLFGQRQVLFPSRYRKGKKVTVIYPKGEPERAEIYSFLRYWISLTKLFFSFMIALFLFMSAVFIGWYNDFKKKYKKA